MGCAGTDLRRRGVLIQHNPNEGLKLEICTLPKPYVSVLIQHNPNEGLKRA